MLVVGRNGVCCGHFVVALGDDSENVDAFERAILAAQAEWQNEGGRSLAIEGVEVTSIAGQADLTLRFATADFRFIHSLQSHLVDSPAEASTWILSVPYEQEDGGDGSSTRDQPIEFVTHLRVSRAAYRAHGCELERCLVGTIQEDLRAAKGVSGTVHYTLGWPDLAIHGSFGQSVGDFLDFVLRIESLPIHCSDGSNVLVFQRALTMVGADWTSIEEQQDQAGVPVVSPSLFFRAQPGRFHDALRALGAAFSDSPTGTYVLDGKWDGSVAFRGSLSAYRFLHRLRQSFPRLRAAGVQRLETHLLTTQTADLAAPGAGAPVDPLALPIRDVCSPCDCSSSLPPATAARKILDDCPGLLQPALRTTVTRSLALIQYALRDTAHCCDLRAPLAACASGLERLLRQAEATLTLVDGAASDPIQNCWYELLDHYRLHVREWCVVLRRVLSERTAGSFEPLFKHSYGLTNYRGGLQKPLLIADRLLHQFYSLLPDALKTDGRAGAPLFATIFTSDATIASKRLTGVIQVPIRYAFSLHLVLPQLWHEAGQHVFHNLYSAPESTLASELDRRIRSLGGAFDQEDSRQQVVHDLSDSFADILVFVFGFRCNYDAFTEYLSTLILETVRYKSMPKTQQERFCVTLVQRLFYVAHFAALWKGLTDDRRARREPEKSRNAVANARAELLREAHPGAPLDVLSRIDKLVLKRQRHRAIAFPLGIGVQVARQIKPSARVYDVLYGSQMDDLVSRLWKAAPMGERASGGFPSSLEKGIVGGTDLGDVSEGTVADWYYRGYREEVARLLDRTADEDTVETEFRRRAALGRMAVLTSYGAM